jgi:two-component system phosphate regulon response regulator OmpR
MMPSGDGIDLIQDIKKTSKTPIIMLTAMSENNDIIDGLKKGTDDYLSKPFEPEELFLRIKNLLKLYENVNQEELLFSFGDLIYKTKTNSLTFNDEEIYLTEGENKLLLKLINNRNNTLSREQLAEEEFDESELRKVDVGITRLRQKIERIPKHPQYIKTIRGKGYMLICKEI